MTRIRQLLVGVALACLLVGCGTVHPTLEDLRAVAGATLQYPGSVEIVGGDIESDSNLMAKNPAHLGSSRCVGASRETWAPWFEQQLAANGWVLQHRSSFPGTDGDVLVGEWRHGDYLFDLYDLSAAHLASLEEQYGAPTGCAYGYQTRVSAPVMDSPQ
jgi:hypothetical protein